MQGNEGCNRLNTMPCASLAAVAVSHDYLREKTEAGLQAEQRHNRNDAERAQRIVADDRIVSRCLEIADDNVGP